MDLAAAAASDAELERELQEKRQLIETLLRQQQSLEQRLRSKDAGGATGLLPATQGPASPLTASPLADHASPGAQSSRTSSPPVDAVDHAALARAAMLAAAAGGGSFSGAVDGHMSAFEAAAHSRMQGESHSAAGTAATVAGTASAAKLTSGQVQGPAAQVPPVSIEELRNQLSNAEAELLLRRVELEALQRATGQDAVDDALRSPSSGGGTETRRLLEELRRIDDEAFRLQEQCKRGRERRRDLKATVEEKERKIADLECMLRKVPGVGASASASSTRHAESKEASAAWRQKAAALEEELKAKSDAVMRLQQRELWFESQLRRQVDSNTIPLDQLLSKVEQLQRTVTRVAPSGELMPSGQLAMAGGHFGQLGGGSASTGSRLASPRPFPTAAHSGSLRDPRLASSASQPLPTMPGGATAAAALSDWHASWAASQGAGLGAGAFEPPSPRFASSGGGVAGGIPFGLLPAPFQTGSLTMPLNRGSFSGSLQPGMQLRSGSLLA
eukprot:TRINITY_DN31355_c0_g1_i1.p1 TRINITY_DN31355_c0_g1~~TRINITY_DN31355_c0_g1_i1.p1  ORF type:complete len:502 (+),score=134.63 TRINITY_DN31355_c0_g1_i1:91-1596(+)